MIKITEVTDKENYYKLKATYEILEIDENPTEEEKKKSYRALCRKYHPDNRGNETKFKEIQNDYNK